MFDVRPLPGKPPTSEGFLSHPVTPEEVGAVITAATACAVGLVSAVLLPRGPVTAWQGLAVMASGLVIGAITGLAWPRRLAVVLAAAAYVATYELVRPGWAAPSVGAIRLDSSMGVILFLLSRGFAGLLVFLPLLVSASVGRWLRQRRLAFPRSTPRTGGRVRRLPTAMGVLATAILALLVALPASTPPVLGADGRPVLGSLAELTMVHLGGHDQAVMIRAAHPDDPVLLYLSGGPGQSDLAYSRAFTSGWVQDFVFVDWDQRGNGKSYGALAPDATMTLDQAVSDTIALTDYLRQRFAEPKIYLMGESWGTILGVLAVQRRPDLYYAWIGSGQMVSVLDTDKRIYSDLLAYAGRTGDATLMADLQKLGAPPYRDFPWANAQIWAYYDLIYKPYTPSPGYEQRGDAAGVGLFGMLGSEYDLVEKTNVLRGLVDTFALMYPQLYGVDLRQTVPRLEVPVYILDGAAELQGRRDLAIQWFDQLQAPLKQRVTYQGAAHSVAFEQADAVQQLLAETIVPATYGQDTTFVTGR